MSNSEDKKLLVVFVKNILLGKVKTRLAAAIGDFGAFEVYKELVAITESETTRLEDITIHIYFSDQVIESKWPNCEKFVQIGDNLGDRMLQAFEQGFSSGFTQIIGVGSDLPDLNSDVISEGFNALLDKDTVFGPAADGGYYLLGMNQLHESIFKNKTWSTSSLLGETTLELEEKGITYSLLNELNDIDTIEDLKASSISSKFSHLYELS